MTPTDPRDEDLAGPEQGGEDLAALIVRVLAERSSDQKALAEASGIPLSTINSWVTRRRSARGAHPDRLRALAKGLGMSARVVFEAVGRQVPGPVDEEREAKLLRIYRSLPETGQRALVQSAEAMYRASRPA